MEIIKTKVGDFKLTFRPKTEREMLMALGSSPCSGCYFYTPESAEFKLGACLFSIMTQKKRECSKPGGREYIYEEVTDIFSVRQ